MQKEKSRYWKGTFPIRDSPHCQQRLPHRRSTVRGRRESRERPIISRGRWEEPFRERGARKMKRNQLESREKAWRDQSDTPEEALETTPGTGSGKGEMKLNNEMRMKMKTDF